MARRSGGNLARNERRLYLYTSLYNTIHVNLDRDDHNAATAVHVVRITNVPRQTCFQHLRKRSSRDQGDGFKSVSSGASSVKALYHDPLETVLRHLSAFESSNISCRSRDFLAAACDPCPRDLVLLHAQR